MAEKDVLGRRGELIAAEFLDRAGIAVLDRNWRCPEGEIDIVARDGETLVVVEVKTRSGVGFGHPLEAVTPAKLARVRRLAGRWRAAHPDERGPLRVDVIGVVLPRAGGRRIEHVVGAFR